MLLLSIRGAQFGEKTKINILGNTVSISLTALSLRQVYKRFTFSQAKLESQKALLTFPSRESCVKDGKMNKNNPGKICGQNSC